MKEKHLLVLSAALLALTYCTASSYAAVIVNYGSAANDVAKAYLGGAAFGTAPNPLSLGNINNSPTRQIGEVKFNISQFNDMQVESAFLNLRAEYFTNTQGLTVPFQINFYALNYDLTSSAFVVGDLTTTNVTLIGSVNISGTGMIAFDLTSALQTAVNADFNYLSIRMVNMTAQAGPFGSPAFVGFTVSPTFMNLSVTAVPEPAIATLFGIGGLALVGVRLLKRRHPLAS